MDKDKYDEGYVAYLEGFEIRDCPYKRGSEEREFWVKGFCDAVLNE